MRPKLTYANVVSTLCLFLLLGGGAYAALRLPKNSVGPRQLKKSAVTTAKIKREAVTAAKVKKGALTGVQIDESKLGTVPTAESAGTARTADGLSPAEPWRLVGAPGEPGFEPGWQNGAATVNPSVAFYRDHEGIVHLRGLANAGGLSSGAVFQLPPGFRPAAGKTFSFVVPCSGSGGPCNSVSLGSVFIPGSGLPSEGDVLVAPGTTSVTLDPVSFRAES